MLAAVYSRFSRADLGRGWLRRVLPLGSAVLLLCLGGSFVWHDGLSSFADDSVSYLVMAQVFSPYAEPSAAVEHAFAQETNYPPAFAVLLALSGGAHSLLQAHLFVALCMVSAWMVFLYYVAQVFDSRPIALGLALVFAGLPGLWTNLLGILSENLYLLLTLAFLVFHVRSDAKGPSRRRDVVVESVLLALIVLTRTVGLSLVAAVALLATCRARSERTHLVQALIPVAVAVAAALFWLAVRPLGLDGLYADIIGGLGRELASEGNVLSRVWSVVAPQLAAVYPAWKTSWMLYWTDGMSIRELAVALIGLITLLGLALRLRDRRLDAWYVVCYVGMVIVWPTAEQMPRFVYPILPILLVHMLWGTLWIVSALGGCARERHIVLGLLGVVGVVSGPALAFIAQRATQAEAAPYEQMTAFYRVPDLTAARAKASLHLELLDALAQVRETTSPHDTIMWYAPGYVALLADRKGVPMPSVASRAAFLAQVADSGADHVFLSNLDPRHTSQGDVLERWLPEFVNFSSLEWARLDESGGLSAVLLRIDRRSLADQVQRARRS